jgi:hypothetical protein
MAVRGLSILDQEELFSSPHGRHFTRRGRRPDDRQLPGSDPIADVDVLTDGDRAVGQADFAALGSVAAPPEDHQGYIDRQVRAMPAAPRGWGSKRVLAPIGHPATTTGTPARRGEPLIRRCHICSTASDFEGVAILSCPTLHSTIWVSSRSGRR